MSVAMSMNEVQDVKEVNLSDLESILTWEKQTTGSQFEEVDFLVSRQNDYTNAAHLFLYARNNESLWVKNKKHAAVLMQMRFDGKLGFTGGLLDSPEEAPVDGLNRELSEEIGLDLSKHSVTQDDHMVTHINHEQRFVAHFYAKEVTMEEFVNIEKNTQNAQDWGGECLGIVRVPLYCLWKSRAGARTSNGLPTFLANQFAGNARYQLVHALHALHVLPRQELADAVLLYAQERGIPTPAR